MLTRYDLSLYIAPFFFCMHLLSWPGCCMRVLLSGRGNPKQKQHKHQDDLKPRVAAPAARGCQPRSGLTVETQRHGLLRAQPASTRQAPGQAWPGTTGGGSSAPTTWQSPTPKVGPHDIKVVALVSVVHCTTSQWPKRSTLLPPMLHAASRCWDTRSVSAEYPKGREA